MTEHNPLLLAFYGDDFTGSTDALEVLSRAGIKTVLFIEPPSPEQLARYQDLQAIGVAGMTRSMIPDDMTRTLQPAFSSLKQLGARHIHYKVCSTFDSSPNIGSIGCAIDIAAGIFSAAFIPVLVGAPALGRYCVFGNLFARMGIGSTGAIHRLDRHPSMSKHPVTPADESDLRLHLARQTAKKMGLIDILQVKLPAPELRQALEGILQNGAELVFFDALYEEQMAAIGELIDAYAENETLFSVGSSGIETALTDHWTRQGMLQPPSGWTDPGHSGPMLVASGSCSPVTAKQIAHALAEGFAEIGIDTEAIAANPDNSSLLQPYIKNAVSLIQEGRSVILHTSRGNDDNRVDRSNDVFASQGLDKATIRSKTAEVYGTALGSIVRNVTDQTPVQRIVLSGGDTSSFAARAMGIEAVEMIAPLSPGAPLCRAYAPGSSVDGLEVNFKGGQVGGEDYFGMALRGR